jgi:hypothetical protein
LFTLFLRLVATKAFLALSGAISDSQSHGTDEKTHSLTSILKITSIKILKRSNLIVIIVFFTMAAWSTYIHRGSDIVSVCGASGL